MLSVLDQTPIFADKTATDTLQECISLAQEVERLGYQRFWVTEYHSSSPIASASPEILIAAIAAKTLRIRIGSGATLLWHYSPLKVAENFHMLHALYPGRIDLGIGRNMGSLSQLCSELLNPQTGVGGIEAYSTRVQELIGFLGNTFPESHPYRNIPVVPQGSATPEVWMMSAYEEGARIAGSEGLPFCLGRFVLDPRDVEVVAEYRRYFRPGQLVMPRVAIAIQVFCADSEEEAIEASRKLCLLMMYSGQQWQAQGLPLAEQRYPSMQEVIDYRYTEQDQNYFYQNNMLPIIVGNPSQVRERLEAIAERYGAEELIITTIFPDFAARLRSYELLAQAFGMIS